MTQTADPWEELIDGGGRAALQSALPAYLMSARWFGGKARDPRDVRIVESVPVPHDGENPAGSEATYMRILFLEVRYAHGEPDHYVLPAAYVHGKAAERVRRETTHALIIDHAGSGDGEGAVYDAAWDPAFARAILEAMGRGLEIPGPGGSIRAWPGAAFRDIFPGDAPHPPTSVMRAQQSNTSIRCGDVGILKFFRRLEEGTSPELEFGRFLSEKSFTHTPPLAGAMEYRSSGAGGEPVTLAILQGFVPNRGDAWSYTLDALEGYMRHGADGAANNLAPPTEAPLELAAKNASVPPEVEQAAGGYMAAARLLGRRTAELHLALASDAHDPAFAPEPFTLDYRRSLYDSIHGLAGQAFGLLEKRLGTLPQDTQAQARALLSRRAEIEGRSNAILQSGVDALRTRCHGDYHLGQVLYTGDDFVIIDFEGEPVRSLQERRQKHSPLKDVAGMLRSFHYAASSAVISRAGEQQGDTRGQPPDPQSRADAWYAWAGASFLSEYLRVAGEGSFLPTGRADLALLLDAYVLEKAIYELVYELNNRPDWVGIPLQGISALL